MVDTLEALLSERGSDRIFGSMIKQAIKRVRPQFSEGFHGFRSFNAMLEAAQSRARSISSATRSRVGTWCA